jgi:hypothetical protein
MNNCNCVSKNDNTKVAKSDMTHACPSIKYFHNHLISTRVVQQVPARGRILYHQNQGTPLHVLVEIEKLLLKTATKITWDPIWAEDVYQALIAFHQGTWLLLRQN